MQIAIPIFDQLTALDCVGPYEVLQRLPGATVAFVGKEKGNVRTDNGFLGLAVDYTFDETKPTTIPFRMVDTSKIKNNIGFDPSYTLLEGLKETITWYRENRLDN